ncbi:hypothetical protein [Yersinia enterocolitica]|uniref:General secretion pathway protein M n=1 Tax=Yersinia enterocolitica TaxID=630 RepID=A0A9P1PU18_YEREN|nr:hypothetical protein [Yersinia enterocolitica]CNF35264.1 Uncharacterised protein [Yersinia enterocolitica]CQH07769.1 Uncharacterised protein [Yersinia enterocolitica]CQH33408.1 Uncharacterised protein [Yersinia enterocolitica]CQH85018.1 Uncharacterised protein [Yersinia enterocolitica]CQJ19092.1 Uncharacterised protein [Yersinia enterocolitica]
MILKNIVTISTLIIALVFFGFSVNTSLEVKVLLEKHSLLNGKLVSHSSLAERIKMEKVSKSKVNGHLDDHVSNVLNTLFNDNDINVKLINMAHDYIYLTIENSHIIKFIDVFFALKQNENIEISYLDIRFVEGGDYINCDIMLRKNHSKVSGNVI